MNSHNFLKKLTFLTSWYVTYVYYQGVRNNSFSENVANVIDEWSHNVNLNFFTFFGDLTNHQGRN